MKIEEKPVDGIVNNIRIIRDEINVEIMHMSFSEERAYLNSLLSTDTDKQIQIINNIKNKTNSI